MPEYYGSRAKKAVLWPLWAAIAATIMLFFKRNPGKVLMSFLPKGYKEVESGRLSKVSEKNVKEDPLICLRGI